VTKREALHQVQQELAREGLTLSERHISAVIETYTRIIREALRTEGRYNVIGLGTFNVTRRKARTGRHPRTGEAIKIKARKAVLFRPAPALKTAV
jgi:DNA-binding protein HU-beta